jgi:hypothetical protein
MNNHIKCLFTIFLSIMSFTCIAQTDMERFFSYKPLKSEYPKKEFTRLDTTKGVVIFYTFDKQQYSKGYKVDSVFKHSYYVVDARNNNSSGRLEPAVYYADKLIIEEVRVIQQVVCRLKKIEIKKEYRFISEKELQ